MRQSGERSPNGFPAVTAIALVGAVVYILIYAPVIRYRNGPDSLRGTGGVMVCIEFEDSFFETPSFYRPLEWLIDQTPCGKLHQRWANVWHVEDTCYRQSDHRRFAKCLERIKAISCRDSIKCD
jgi:hypothetical protein